MEGRRKEGEWGGEGEGRGEGRWKGEGGEGREGGGEGREGGGEGRGGERMGKGEGPEETGIFFSVNVWTSSLVLGMDLNC